MREIRTYGSEGGGAARSPYPYQQADFRGSLDSRPGLLSAGVRFVRGNDEPSRGINATFASQIRQNLV